MLDTHGPKADEIASLWWLNLALALGVLVLVMLLLGLALLRQRRPPGLDARDLARVGLGARFGGTMLVVVFGFAVPVVVLGGVLFLDVRSLARIAGPPAPPQISVDVIGHQFWWEFTYTRSGVTSPNELHIPTGQPVLLKISGGDVIHSLWIPQLMGKLDAIPAQTNTTWLQADQPGTYRGECAEFCGAQHAHMGFLVLAEPADQFESWLAQQQQPAIAVSDQLSAQGVQAFSRAGCIACHTIRYGATAIGGHIGPDLTHVGSRHSLAANSLPNTPDAMAGWIADPQGIKPGSLMPGLPLDAATLGALAAYLESLR
jgi:cytochrome c oxidase subunit 2